MAWRRYWLSESCFHDDQVMIEGDTFHHIFVVCRMHEGDCFEVIHPRGQAYLIEVERVEKKRAWGRLREGRDITPLPRPHLHLVVGVSRFHKMDEIIEKAVELGVKSVRPALTEYSFVRKLQEVGENRLRRWQKIVLAATQQCGRGDLLEVRPASALEELLREFGQSANAAGLFPYEGEGQLGLRQALSTLAQNRPDEIWLFVGSEGGFSLGEVQRFGELNLPPVSLGPQILRVETACVVVLTTIKYELGLMG